MIDIIIIVFFTYMLLLLEKQATVDVGGGGGAFANIDRHKNKKLYAPFKYRPLANWLANLFNITAKNLKPLLVWTERYYYNIYLMSNDGLEKYYVFKYILFLIVNFVFYWYIELLGMNGIVGVFVLDSLISLTFIYDNLDYLLEITFYTLFLIGVLSGYSFIYFGIVSILASLNRESSIFLIPISFFYCDFVSFISTCVGFTVGFVIPRYIYKDAVDNYDKAYSSGFKFLCFNPIKNWTNSIWPHLKQRFYKISSNFNFQYENKQYDIGIEKKPVTCTIKKEIFLNRIFLGIVFILFCFSVFIFKYSDIDPFFHILTWIMSVFIVMISLPADIREIRVYSPVFVILVPYLIF